MDRVIGSTLHIPARIAEVRVVESIEELRAELRLPALSHLEILHQTQIEIAATWPCYDGPAGVSESVNPVIVVRFQEGGREARIIEPMVDRGVGEVAITRPVRTLRVGVRDVGKVLARRNCFGNPVWILKIAEACQPPSIAFGMRPMPEAKCLPRPNGNSATLLNVNRCRTSLMSRAYSPPGLLSFCPTAESV